MSAAVRPEVVKLSALRSSGNRQAQMSTVPTPI